MCCESRVSIAFERLKLSGLEYINNLKWKVKLFIIKLHNYSVYLIKSLATLRGLTNRIVRGNSEYSILTGLLTSGFI